MNQAIVLDLLKQELQPSRLIPNLIAGLMAGVIAVTYALSFSFLVFSGDLARFLPQYVGFALFSTAMVGLVVTFASSTIVLAHVQDTPAAISGINAIAIAATLPTDSTSDQVFLTLVVTLGVTTFLTGLVTWGLGRLKLGSLIRCIPYPVVGGFLAGTGWLLFSGSFRIAADISLSDWPLLFQRDRWPLAAANLVFALGVLIGSRRSQHWALIPCSIMVAITLFYGGMLLTQTPLAAVTDQGWLLDIPATVEPWRPLSPLVVTQVDWLRLLPQTWGILSVALITVISMLLNFSGIEVSTQRDIDLNQELKAVGIGNVLTGLGGGLIGYHGVSVSLLMDKIGARGRLSGLVAVAVSLAVLMAGTSVIALVPKFLLGGLVAFLGLSLLLEWLYDAWFKLTLVDYFNVVTILGVIVFVGFLPGVAYGIMVAAILFVINYSLTAVSRHPLNGASYRSRVRRPNSHERILRNNGEQIYILKLQGLLFFGTGSKLLAEVKDRLYQTDLKPLKILVLDFRLVSGIDSSAVVSFVKLRHVAQKNDLSFVFTSLSDTIEGLLRQGGALTTDDPTLHIFPDLDRGVAWCEDHLLQQSTLRRSRAMPLFIQLKATFPVPELVPLLMQTYLVPMQLDPGENLFQRGEDYDGLYFVESGQVSLLDPLPNGSIERVATYKRGTTIGERGLYQKSTHRFSAVADSKSRLYFLPTKALERMEDRHPQLASALHRFVVQSMVERLDYRDQEF